jgi:secondary thiamine-phosphate synthase enzyme
MALTTPPGPSNRRLRRSTSMTWHQTFLTLPPHPRGFHLITSLIIEDLPELKKVRLGLLNVFLQHTSASLTINENVSPEVRRDMESIVNRLVPESGRYAHDLEGPDDMPAHMKASLLGPSLTIPVRDGRLALGTWQGIYLCEHRDQGGPRQLMLTLNGESL